MIGSGWYEARHKLHRTLRSIAEEVGCSAAFLCDIEHGRRNPGREMEIKLRAALQLPPPAPPPADPLCVVCGTALTPRTIQHHAVHDPNGIIGPGYRDLQPAWTEPDGFSCPRCGIRYDKRPEILPR